MKEYYEKIKDYIDKEKTDDITDSILLEQVPLYDNGYAVEDVVKELIWFLRADDNLRWLWDEDFMCETGWEKEVNRFGPLEGQTSLRFYLDGNELCFIVTQHGIDLLEEAPYWMLYYSIFHKVVYHWTQQLGWGYQKGSMLYNFVDSFIVVDEGEAHLPEFEKGWDIEIGRKHPQELKVEDFKLVKQ